MAELANKAYAKERWLLLNKTQRTIRENSRAHASANEILGLYNREDHGKGAAFRNIVSRAQLVEDAKRIANVNHKNLLPALGQLVTVAQAA
jgi:hypothetical protein